MMVPLCARILDTLDDDDEVLWALAEQLGDRDFVVFVGGDDYAHTLLVSLTHTHTLLTHTHTHFWLASHTHTHINTHTHFWLASHTHTSHTHTHTLLHITLVLFFVASAGEFSGSRRNCCT